MTDTLDEGGQVLVTGAGGFIGSHLVEALLDAGHRVKAMVRYNSGARSGWLEEIQAHERLSIVYGDITDSRMVSSAAEGCEVIYHLAALIGIPYSYVAPESYVAVNTVGTLNFLEAARTHGVGRVVITSTSEVYGTAQYTPMDESHPLQAQSPYAATKIAADQIALSYYRSFGMPVTVVRPFNTFGPRQSTRAVLPTIITQALVADKIRIGSTTPVRDMVFVRDTARGFIAAASSDACIGQVTNLATGVGVTVGEMIELVQRIVGRDLPVEEQSDRRRPEQSEVFTLLGNAEAAQSRANWSAGTSLDEGLRQTIEWFKSNTNPRTAGAYTV
ncbi:SDR family NAD(P)-dependent oxidoreductase [Stratiformator vulcanicus]|uniref:dTDP-glucose 4,6-dehydratase n=1 Tax=Stratiformator vulcanicus TaxID=2527980 RepID=A0A517QY79_9PLAN|nr:SDR family NAD(P)-dependent oxidoreductase [Stratiformator vulcanicus]QDT36595.1 dTDP-glucose 4,6-dehydratase [Stratiformator vulcanicus]